MILIYWVLIILTVLVWIWLGAKIFWKVGFKELDSVLGTKFSNYKKEEKNDNKENK
jgi:hypothetical protein